MAFDGLVKHVFSPFALRLKADKELVKEVYSAAKRFKMDRVKQARLLLSLFVLFPVLLTSINVETELILDVSLTDLWRLPAFQNGLPERHLLP